MNFKYLFIIFISCLTITLFAQRKEDILVNHLENLKNNPQDPSALLSLCDYYFKQGNYSKTVTYAEYIKNQIYSQQNSLIKLYAHLYLGQAQMMSGREKIAKRNLDLALELATQLNNDSVLCTLYGALGQYSANIEVDYYQAIRWTYKGIGIAQKNKFYQQYGLLLSQLANIHYLKRDGNGLKYALESYELGHHLKDSFLIYSGAIQSAYMYFLNKHHEQAMKYVQEAEALMTINNFYDQAHTFNLLGQLLDELGNYNQASAYYQKAMNDKQTSQTSSIIYAYLGYARMLIKQKKYQDAIILLKQSIAISQARNNAVHRNQLYETLSICYEEMGQYQNALNAYKSFRTENDSLFNESKERDINEIRYRYDNERQENLIKQSKLEMIQKENRLQQLYYVLLIIIIVLGLLYYLYRRKNYLYFSIVKQNQDAIKRESKLQQRILELENINLSSEKYASSSLTEEKSLELFQRLERLMKEKMIYKDNTINKDKVSELLNTNRTYLSRVINEQAQMSFTHYINHFRIEEAIRILSDSQNQTPLKAISAELGFNSISTFYNLFQNEVGMTPAQYRSKVLELKKHR